MNNYRLKTLELENFCMYAEASFLFGEDTEISGANGKGKSSIINAYMWLMFNCDSDLKDNPVVRHEVDGKPIIDADVSVTGVFDVNGKEVTVKKVQKRKYSKDGYSYKDDNSYFINDVPKTLKDYNEYLGITKELKMCCNINAFLAQKPDEVRKYLFSNVETMTDYDISAKFPELADLTAKLRDYTLEEVRAMNQKAITESKKAADIYKGRIQEVERSIAIKEDADTAEIELGLAQAQRELEENLAQQTQAGNLEATFYSKKEELFNLQNQLNSLSDVANADNDKKRKELQFELTSKTDSDSFVLRRMANIEADIKSTNDLIKCDVNERNELREKYRETKGLAMDDKAASCPYCGQKYPAEKLESIKADFEKKKAAMLADITTKGNKLAEEIACLRESLPKAKERLAQVKAEHKELEARLAELHKQLDKLPQKIDVSGTKEYKALEKKIKKLSEELNATDYLSELRLLKASETKIRDVIAKYKAQIAHADSTADRERLEILRAENLQREQTQADAERIIELCKELDKQKNDLLCEVINSKFKLVKWQLYEYSKGGEYKSVCIPKVDGKSILTIASNKGNRILGKIDICQSLQKNLNVSYPLWLDDAEALDSTNRKRIAEMSNSQLIMLRVTDNKNLELDSIER